MRLYHIEEGKCGWGGAFSGRFTLDCVTAPVADSIVIGLNPGVLIQQGWKDWKGLRD